MSTLDPLRRACQSHSPATFLEPTESPPLLADSPPMPRVGDESTLHSQQTPLEWQLAAEGPHPGRYTQPHAYAQRRLTQVTSVLRSEGRCNMIGFHSLAMISGY